MYTFSIDVKNLIFGRRVQQKAYFSFKNKKIYEYLMRDTVRWKKWKSLDIIIKIYFIVYYTGKKDFNMKFGF